MKLSELLSIAKLQKSSYEYAVKAKDRKKPEKLDDMFRTPNIGPAITI